MSLESASLSATHRPFFPQNPGQFTAGVAEGTRSLFSNTVFAFSNAATRLSGAARKVRMSAAPVRSFLACTILSSLRSLVFRTLGVENFLSFCSTFPRRTDTTESDERAAFAGLLRCAMKTVLKLSFISLSLLKITSAEMATTGQLLFANFLPLTNPACLFGRVCKRGRSTGSTLRRWSGGGARRTAGVFFAPFSR